MRKLFTVSIAILALSACAPNYLQRGNNAFQERQYKQAFDNYMQCARQGNPSCMNNIGVIYRSIGRMELATGWFRLAARLGDQTAGKNLQEIGEPIPARDLAWPKTQHASTDQGAWAIFNTLLQSYNDSLDRRTNVTTCDGLLSGNIVTVNCN